MIGFSRGYRRQLYASEIFFNLRSMGALVFNNYNFYPMYRMKAGMEDLEM